LKKKLENLLVTKKLKSKSILDKVKIKQLIPCLLSSDKNILFAKKTKIPTIKKDSIPKPKISELKASNKTPIKNIHIRLVSKPNKRTKETVADNKRFKKNPPPNKAGKNEVCKKNKKKMIIKKTFFINIKLVFKNVNGEIDRVAKFIRFREKFSQIIFVPQCGIAELRQENFPSHKPDKLENFTGR
jgi:hypothetical protein